MAAFIVGFGAGAGAGAGLGVLVGFGFGVLDGFGFGAVVAFGAGALVAFGFGFGAGFGAAGAFGLVAGFCTVLGACEAVAFGFCALGRAGAGLVDFGSDFVVDADFSLSAGAPSSVGVFVVVDVGSGSDDGADSGVSDAVGDGVAWSGLGVGLLVTEATTVSGSPDAHAALPNRSPVAMTAQNPLTIRERPFFTSAPFFSNRCMT